MPKPPGQFNTRQTRPAPSRINAISVALRSLLGATALVVVAACSNSGDSSDEHIALAKQHLAQAEYSAAVIELKNALQIDGKSAQARWLLGEAYLNGGNPTAAEKELLQAEKLGWDMNDIRPALAGALIMQRKYTEVGELAHEELEPAAAARLLSSKALAELAQAEPEKARIWIDHALDLQPDSVDAKMAEARLLASQGDPIGSLIVLEEVLEHDAVRGEAWSLKGDILLSQKNLPEALTAYDKSIALSQNAYNERLKRALIYLQNQDYEAARADTDLVLQAIPQHALGNYVSGLLYFQTQNYEEAITALSQAEPAWRQLPLVLFYLSGAYLMDGKPEQATSSAERFHKIVPDNVNGRKLLATIRQQQGKYADVQQLMQPVLEQDPNDLEALNLMANALMSEGNTDQGINYLAQIAQLQPDSAIAQVKLGAGLLITGKGDDASQHIEAALDLDPKFQRADILLVLSHLQKRDFDNAIQAAKDYQDRNPGSVTALNLLGRVYLASGKRQEAINTFEEVLKADAGDPAANQSLAQLDIETDNLALARTRYQAVLEHHPDYLPTLLQLAYLDAKEQDESSMVKHLEQAVKAHPSALEPRLLLGRYYLGKGKAEQVAPLFATLNDLQKRSPEVLQLLALAQLSGKQDADAKYTLEQLIESTPDTAHYHHLLALAAAGSGDETKVKEELRKALELDENYIPSLLAAAKLARLERESDEFLKYLTKLTRLAPEAPEVFRLRAAAALDKGDYAGALELGTRAYNMAPTTQTMQELAAYHQAAGDVDKAFELQRNWINNHPQDITARLGLADTLRVAKVSDEMQTQYRAVLELEPDNLIALNNLAWAVRQENPEQALEYITRASELAPERLDVLDSLAVIQHLNGDNRRAIRNIRRALAKAPGNPSMLYHQAMIEAALGEKTTAISLLEELLDKHAGDFPEREDAQTLLTSLKN